MAYGDFKDLTRRLIKYNVIRNLILLKIKKNDGYQQGLASMVYKYFDKETSVSGIQSENISNKQLSEELHKPIIRKFEKRKVHLPFIDNIWGTDLGDIQLRSEFLTFLLCVIDNYSKYAWVIPLKVKKEITITNALKKSLMNLIAIQMKYGQIKAANFIIDQ